MKIGDRRLINCLGFHLLLWEFFGAAPGDDCLVVYSVLVVLVPKHGVVRNQGEHHHVL